MTLKEVGKGEGKRKGREDYDCCVLHVVVVLINVISDCNCKLPQLQQRKQREKTKRERGGEERRGRKRIAGWNHQLLL